MRSNCIFCKIIRGDLPGTKVYENDQVVAFLDIAPAAKGHTLLVPREHWQTLFDVPDSVGQALLTASKNIGLGLMRGLGAEGVNVMQNNFAAAGQMVFHVHWHLIPRFTDDGLRHWPQGSYDSPDEMREFAAQITAGIKKHDE